MDGDLICNLKKCRKQIRSFAWVTSCSHVFCDEDGSREFNKALQCPACETTLSGKFDIIRSDLQPTEQWKSMVIAGQRPDVIMEICTRALSYWTYQILCTSRPERLTVLILGLGICLLVVYQKIVYDDGFLDRRELYTERLKKILEHTSLQSEFTLTLQNMTHNVSQSLSDRLVNRKSWEYHEHGNNEKGGGNKYLIYLCNKQVPCGDWGVRQFGIMSMYLLANVTNRIFKLSMTSPCRLEQFLVPSDIDWLPYINELRGKSLHVVNDVNNSSFVDVIKAGNFNDVYSQEIIFVRATENLINVIKQNPFYKDALPEWAHSNNSDLFTDAWNTLVKPTPYLKNKLQYLLNRIYFVPGSSTCAYIQPGNMTRILPSTIRHIILLLDKIAKSMVFISTGSEELLRVFRKRYNNTCVVSGGHVDGVINTTDLCLGLETVILDQLILTHCPKVILSSSTFGKMTSKLRWSKLQMYHTSNAF